MSKKKKKGAPHYMTTYGDMMTLLLCFFVLLYTFSTLDVTRFEMVITALKGQMGVLDGGRTLSREEFIEAGLEDRDLARDLEEVYYQISEFVHEKDLQDEVYLEPSERGLIIRFSGRSLFDLGKAFLRPDAVELLDHVSLQIQDIPNYVLAEGHTDDWPISTAEFPTNWELSTARATTVIRYFIEEKELEPFRFSAAGYSEYHPIRPNDSEENRALNRRVDLVILREDIGFERLEGN